MKPQQVRILLEKINALHKSIDLDEGAISAIERDLMLSYIRQLYDIYLNAGQRSNAVPPEDAPANIQQPENPAPQERPRPEPIRRNPYKPPRIIEIPDREEVAKAPPKKTPPPSHTPKTEPAPAPELEKSQSRVEATTTTPPARQEPAPVASDQPQLRLLFEQRQATELSEKLSESPISDLTKSMSINDRLLYMNELFAKNMQHLEDTLRQLNGYRDMKEAQPLLFDLARRHDWLDEEKQDTAKDFIKMVRRRYI